MAVFLQDVRYAVRLLRRSPGFSIVAIFTLALGVAANTAIFSVIEGVILRPLAYKDSQRLVSIVRVIPDSHKDIGLNILSQFHYGPEIQTVTFETLADAVQSLAGDEPCNP